MRTIQLLTLLILLTPLAAHGQTPGDTTRFVNRGKMYVAPIPGAADVASLYIPHGVRMIDSTSIVQNGVTAIGGNFYQDSDTSVFKLDAEGNFTVSTGKVRFFGDHADRSVWPQRAITIWGGSDAKYPGPDSLELFNREKAYIAFPDIEINTSDTIHVPFTMGMDAIDITRGAAGASGVLYLESDPNSAKNKVFDASLRTTGDNVAAGAVVIEKYVWPFRNPTSNNAYLYPFASPYTNQRAGYFAGNWVRTPQWEDSTYWYPYANKASANDPSYIDYDQYVRYADDELKDSIPYLIHLQPQGYNYGAELPPFILTGGNEHNLERFVFDGTPYNLNYSAEQKFTADTLFSRTAETNMGHTQNWIIGNSYTSALSIDSVAKKIVESQVIFSPLLYILPHGALTYEAHDISDLGNLAGIPDIPAMSVFMIVVDGSNASTEPFAITRQMQKHTGGIDGSSTPSPYSSPRYASRQDNSLSFKLTPEDNPYIYDRSYIRLQQGAFKGPDRYDIDKSLNASNQYFQVYSQTGKSKLQTNALPLSTEQVDLCVTPPAHSLSCLLTVDGVETVHASSLLLHDKQLNAWTDLKETPEYVFTSEPGDSPERFTVYFKTPTGINTPIINTGIYACYGQGILTINRLTEEDRGSHLKIYTTSGALIKETEITSYPRYELPLALSPGVYIAKIEGSRSAVVKFIKR